MIHYSADSSPRFAIRFRKKSCISTAYTLICGKKIRIVLYALALMFVAGIQSPEARDITPSDPLASPEVKWLLEFLASLPSKTSNKVVSGQYHKDHIDTIYKETRARVGLLNERFANARGGWDAGWAEAVPNRQAMLDHWNAGGIVQVFMPMPNPKTKGDDRDLNFTNSDMISARTAGSAINVNFRQWLDRWATHAQWLEDRHVPLIIRPLHEHNCCFWYVDKPDLPNFYRYIFNYLTKTKGLHNLLFAHSVAWWGGNNGPASDKHQYMTFYPGDAYVDILGFDAYKDLSPTSSILTSDDFRVCPYFRPRRKPIALTEFGPDDAAAPNAAKADYRKLIKGIRSYCPEITYWNSWSVEWSMTSENNNFVKDLLNDPWVVNLNDIPRH